MIGTQEKTRQYEDIHGLGLSFRLDPNFISDYVNREVRWGYGVISELVFLRSYSRTKDSRTGTSWPYDHKNLNDQAYGGKERWWETCERVINGMYSIQKDHILAHNMTWDEDMAQSSAQEAYERMFEFKWTPPGRGLWAMGTYLVNGKKDSSALYNCHFVSTKNIGKDFAAPFTHLMHASMHGGGVGFDVSGAVETTIVEPKGAIPYKIPDSSEGWVKSLELLLKAYQGGPMPHFDYSGIRKEGELIVTFGGIAPGPEPLRKMHNQIKALLDSKIDHMIDSKTIMDIFNIIGVAVVSGNVRRSSEIGLANYELSWLWNVKDYTQPENEYRAEWGWMSNNSLKVHDYTEVDFDAVVAKINDGYETWNKGAGEPGLFFIDNARNYGRMNNGPDFADVGIEGCNPCGEIGLEDGESCNVAEQYLMRHSNVSDYRRTLKFIYLYCKTVTLLPTKWPKTNEVQLRNRRIGVSLTGVAHFVDTMGYDKLKEWMDEGYHEVRRWDKIYSRWLGVRESIKVTTCKPSGSVSLLAGTTAGVHWPVAEHYVRRMMLPKDFPLLPELRRAGYAIETSVQSPESSVVIEVPLSVPGVRPESEVSVYEKVGLVALVQKWWADNMVSNTIVYDPENEVRDLANALKMHASGLKSVAALPRATESYEQLPEQAGSQYVIDYLRSNLKDVDFSSAYDGDTIIDDAVKNQGCDSDVCEVSFG